MPMTIDDFITQLIKFRNLGQDHGKAEVMLELKDNTAFEFAQAELAVATYEAGTHLERFLVLSANERGKRLELKSKIQR